MAATWKNFPLFARSVQHNQTIEGIEECEIQMARERKRRKKEQLPILTEEAAKAFRSFANFSKIKAKSMEAGLDMPPEDQISLPDLVSREDIDDVDDDPCTPEKMEKLPIDEQYDEFALPLIGMKAQIHGLNVRSKFNGAIVSLEKWDKHHKHFECRLEKTLSVIKVGFNHLKLIEEHGTEVGRSA